MPQNIAASIDAAVRIPASMGEYVRRFVTITAPGLTIPVLKNTLVSVVVRLHIQEAAQLTKGPRNQENTMFLIQPINRFLFSNTNRMAWRYCTMPIAMVLLM